MAKKSISVIIPNYNGKQLLHDYLPFTIAAIQNAQTAYEIIIVDDASQDDSVAFIHEEYPQIKLLVNQQNSGFSHTCNQGIAVAKCDLILLLNSDVKLLPDYFEQQFKYFDHPDTFGVMGRIIDMEGDHIQDAARLPKLNGFKLKTAFFYYTDNPNDRLLTFYLSGANALIDAGKLKQLGGFDELFSPFYCEDMELGIRAWRMGWKSYYEHQSVCRHQVSASTKNYKTATWVKSIYFRNRYYMHALHLNGLALGLWFLQITVVDLVVKLLTGKLWIWKSYTGFLNHFSVIARSRKSFKSLMQQQGSSISIFDVVDEIKASISNTQVTRIKL